MTYLKNKVLCKLVVCVTSSKMLRLMEESGRHGEPNIFSPKPLTFTSSMGASSLQINDVENSSFSCEVVLKSQTLSTITISIFSSCMSPQVCTTKVPEASKYPAKRPIIKSWRPGGMGILLSRLQTQRCFANLSHLNILLRVKMR